MHKWVIGYEKEMIGDWFDRSVFADEYKSILLCQSIFYEVTSFPNTLTNFKLSIRLIKCLYNELLNYFLKKVKF